MSGPGAALQAPPGQVIDYAHSPDIGYKVVDVSLATIAISTLAVVVRIGVKSGMKNNSGWDDYAMVVALLFAIAQVVVNVLLVKRWGVGHHSWDVPLKNYNSMLNFIEIDTVLYLFAIMFAKLSILLFYHRLFSINVRFRWALYAVSAIVVGYCTSLALATIFQCTPPAAVWNLKLREQTHCISQIKIDIAVGGFNIPTDIIILILPAPMLWRLQMPISKKLGLMAILATGIFVCATAIVREVIIVQTLRNSDEAWTVVDSILWLTLETNIGILCGCLPSLQPIFRYIGTKGFFSAASLLSLFSSPFSAKHSKRHGSEDEGPKDSQKRTYRVLVESGKKSEDSQAKLRIEKSECSLPHLPLAVHEGNDSLPETSSRNGDVEQGRILVTDQFGYH